MPIIVVKGSHDGSTNQRNNSRNNNEQENNNDQNDQTDGGKFVRVLHAEDLDEVLNLKVYRVSQPHFFTGAVTTNLIGAGQYYNKEELENDPVLLDAKSIYSKSSHHKHPTAATDDNDHEKYLENSHNNQVKTKVPTVLQRMRAFRFAGRRRSSTESRFTQMVASELQAATMVKAGQPISRFLPQPSSQEVLAWVVRCVNEESYDLVAAFMSLDRMLQGQPNNVRSTSSPGGDKPKQILTRSQKMAKRLATLRDEGDGNLNNANNNNINSNSSKRGLTALAAQLDAIRDKGTAAFTAAISSLSPTTTSTTAAAADDAIGGSYDVVLSQKISRPPMLSLHDIIASTTTTSTSTAAAAAGASPLIPSHPMTSRNSNNNKGAGSATARSVRAKTMIAATSSIAPANAAAVAVAAGASNSNSPRLGQPQAPPAVAAPANRSPRATIQQSPVAVVTAAGGGGVSRRVVTINTQPQVQPSSPTIKRAPSQDDPSPTSDDGDDNSQSQSQQESSDSQVGLDLGSSSVIVTGGAPTMTDPKSILRKKINVGNSYSTKPKPPSIPKPSSRGPTTTTMTRRRAPINKGKNSTDAAEEDEDYDDNNEPHQAEGIGSPRAGPVRPQRSLLIGKQQQQSMAAAAMAAQGPIRYGNHLQAAKLQALIAAEEQKSKENDSNAQVNSKHDRSNKNNSMGRMSKLLAEQAAARADTLQTTLNARLAAANKQGQHLVARLEQFRVAEISGKGQANQQLETGRFLRQLEAEAKLRLLCTDDTNNTDNNGFGKVGAHPESELRRLRSEAHRLEQEEELTGLLQQPHKWFAAAVSKVRDYTKRMATAPMCCLRFLLAAKLLIRLLGHDSPPPEHPASSTSIVSSQQQQKEQPRLSIRSFHYLLLSPAVFTRDDYRKPIVQQVLEISRLGLGISAEDFLHFLELHDLPVPAELQAAIRAQHAIVHQAQQQQATTPSISRQISSPMASHINKAMDMQLATDDQGAPVLLVEDKVPPLVLPAKEQQPEVEVVVSVIDITLATTEAESPSKRYEGQLADEEI